MEPAHDDGSDARAPDVADVDPTDFDAWVSARGTVLVRFALVLTGNRSEAEDAVQDALSRALPRWERICRADDPDAYVRRMIVNAHVTWWRRFRRREGPTTVPFDDYPGVHPGDEHDDEAGTAVDRLAVWRACQSLPIDQRVAIVLRYYEDLPYARIAELTGVREGSVRARVSRGLVALRSELGDQDD